MSTQTLDKPDTQNGYDVVMPNTNILGFKELSELLGVGINSVHTYHARATQHRKQAAESGDLTLVRPGDLPAPDGRFGNAPYWYPRTIERWIQQRPGRGGHNKEAAKRNSKLNPDLLKK